MNFFETELRKIVGTEYPDATFVGRACYVRLNDMNQAKIEFTTCGTAEHYEALQMTILNRNEGKVDSLRLRFADVWGKRLVNNPNFRNGVNPHAWTYNDQTEWYAYKPGQADYCKISESVTSYLNVFRTLEERKPSIDFQIEQAASNVTEARPSLDVKAKASEHEL